MSLGPNLGLLVGVINRPLKTLGWQLFYEIFRLDTVKIIPLLVLVIGPITRARSKRFQEDLGDRLNSLMEKRKEETKFMNFSQVLE